MLKIEFILQMEKLVCTNIFKFKFYSMFSFFLAYLNLLLPEIKLRSIWLDFSSFSIDFLNCKNK